MNSSIWLDTITWDGSMYLSRGQRLFPDPQYLNININIVVFLANSVELAWMKCRIWIFTAPFRFSIYKRVCMFETVFDCEQ